MLGGKGGVKFMDIGLQREPRRKSLDWRLTWLTYKSIVLSTNSVLAFTPNPTYSISNKPCNTTTCCKLSDVNTNMFFIPEELANALLLAFRHLRGFCLFIRFQSQFISVSSLLVRIIMRVALILIPRSGD